MFSSKNIVVLIILTALISSCDNDRFKDNLKTENIILIVIDGARYSETWGDVKHENIPHIADELAPFGIVNTNFYNNGPTYTLAGHTAIATGYYQEIENTGEELPQYPSVLQYWNAKYVNSDSLAYIIASKDKLEVLNNCQLESYKDKYTSISNCGVSGLGSGYRDDSISIIEILHTFKQNKPRLTYINFRDPDFSAHQNDWELYLEGIKKTDTYINQIWEYIHSDSYYKDKTTLFITNDHGRHLDGVAGGFAQHGDGCEGCRHIFLYAYGPDFKEGLVIDNKRELIDITATIAKILDVNMEYGEGNVMEELFK